MKKLLFILLLFVISCDKDIDDFELYNKTWTLTELNGNQIVSDDAFIKFDYNSVNGENSCNSFSGNYFIDKHNSITFYSFVTTKVACINNTIENEFMDVLKNSKSYSTNHSELYLFNSNKVIIAKFEIKCY